jgi:hypothetical protein
LEGISGVSSNLGVQNWPVSGASVSDAQLAPEEQREVNDLRETDAKVRRHEQAHLAAAGKYAMGRASFEYETGPDGKQYAVSGEVQIDVSPVSGDPEATIEKAETVQKAALAPQDPSPQDRRVAAQAARMEAEARRELAQEAGESQLGYDQAANPVSASPDASFLNLFV